MVSRRRFTLLLAVWVVALALALIASILAFQTDGLGAARIVAGAVALSCAAGLWHHVTRTNRMMARFIEALHFGDTSSRFGGEQGAGFGELGDALNDAMAKAHARQQAAQGELRFYEALADDMPVALLTVDAEGRVTLGNKAARRLFSDVEGVQPEDFSLYSATFARHLAEGGPSEALLLLALNGMPQNVLVRSARLDRLGRQTRVVTVQPVQGMLNTVEAAVQTDLVRVLTHEILNSLTPVTSLAETAAGLLQDPELGQSQRISDARAAVSALARRAGGLSHFIEAYRAVARAPQVERRDFLAKPWAEELLRVFEPQTLGISVALTVEPADLVLNADPDLLAQVIINLLRNAAQAMEGHTAQPSIAIRILAPRELSMIEVEDNGPGVPAGIRQDIFLPFFTTRKHGNGVGLNLARQIAIAHGGAIEVTEGRAGGALIRLGWPAR